MKTIYRAFDGTEFEDFDDCVEYEDYREKINNLVKIREKLR